MSSSLSMFSSYRNRYQMFPNDCTICATRPALYLNRLNVYQADFFCNHSVIARRPRFKPSTFFKTINIVCSILLVVGIINDVLHLSGLATTKYLFLLGEIAINIATILVNSICLWKNDIKIKESHGLIMIINNKNKFGISEVLPAKSAKKIYNTLFLFVLLLWIEEIITLVRTIIAEELDVSLLIRIVIIEIIIFSNASIGLYVIHFLILYDGMFDHCYRELEKCLRVKKSGERRYVLEKLRKIQRLYLSLKRNFKLNEDFLQPWIIIIYTTEICLLLIGYSYFAVLFVEEELNFLRFDVYLVGKSVAIVFVFCGFCYGAYHVFTMV